MTQAKAKPAVIPHEDLVRKLQLLAGGGGVWDPELAREDTALLVVDVQYKDAHPDYGLGARAKELGIEDFLDYYLTRVKDVMVPNIQRIMAVARRTGVEVIHVRIAAATSDGRDSTPRFKRWGLSTPRDVKEAEILPEVAPEGDELVISKVTESVFNSTNIDRVLRNMGIENLIIVGVVTNGCVEGAVRGAVELGYGAILVEDATAALTKELHEFALVNMGHKDAAIKSSDEVIEILESL